MTTKVALLDCPSGIAGDMTLGALVDAGVDIEALRILIGMLGLPPVTITATKVNRAGTAATHVVVRPSQERTYRPDEMKALVQSARVAERGATIEPMGRWEYLRWGLRARAVRQPHDQLAGCGVRRAR